MVPCRNIKCVGLISGTPCKSVLHCVGVLKKSSIISYKFIHVIPPDNILSRSKWKSNYNSFILFLVLGSPRNTSSWVGLLDVDIFSTVSTTLGNMVQTFKA